jgi:II/X family phage/plasmid replication protein
MLDHLRLLIPVHENHLIRLDDGTSVIKGSIGDFGFKLASRHVERLESGVFEAKDLYAPYESLPSSYSGLAVKFFDKSTMTDPYVEIKASPAKLLQGHNVYGGESVGNAACEMFGILFQSIPELGERLDISLATIGHIDTTFSSTVTNEAIIPKIIDYLSRISNGQTKATKNKKYETTAYWGGETSRLLQLKAYAKYPELLVTVEKLKKQAAAHDTKAQMLLDTVYTPELLNFAKKLLRWEARIKARKLERMGLPVGLFDFIKYQNENPNILTELWRLAFTPIFDTFKGQAMPYSTDDDLHQMLKEHLKTITPTGRVSYTRANNAMNFFHLVRDIGFEAVKARYSSSTFYDNLKNLTDAGLSKAWLQNLHTKKKGDIVPLVNFCHVDFVAQFPTGYTPPVSRFNLPLVA